MDNRTFELAPYDAVEVSARIRRLLLLEKK
jgi:hypothetical protein